MDEEDDDLYGPSEPTTETKKEPKKEESVSSGDEPMDEGADSGDDDDDSDSDEPGSSDPEQPNLPRERLDGIIQRLQELAAHTRLRPPTVSDEMAG